MNSAQFQDAIKLGQSRSDCHPDNLLTLVNVVGTTREVPGDIIECGSYKCGATIALAAAADYFNTTKQVFGLDLFGGLPYGEGAGFENFADADFEEIKAVTAPFKNIVLVKGLHEDTIPEFAKTHTTLSMIFMDSDFYASHKVCLEWLWPRLSSGGYIVFHDWTFAGVQQAINETLNPSEWSDTGLFSNHFLQSGNMGYIVKA